MQLGICERLPGNGERGPSFLRRVVEACERLGFHQFWYPEHPVYFPAYGDVYPYRPGEAVSQRTGVVDAFSALAFAAACTTTLRFGTFVTVIAERHPLHTARAASALDVLTGGRFELGVGVGWSEQEYQAFDVPFARRGARTDEYLTVLTQLWAHPEFPGFAGEFVTLPRLRLYPPPVQRPHLPLMIGGNSDAAIRRTVRHGDGWLGLHLSIDELSSAVRSLRAEAERAGRDPATIALRAGRRLSVERSGRASDIDYVSRCRDLGLDQVILAPNFGLGSYEEDLETLVTDLESAVK